MKTKELTIPAFRRWLRAQPSTARFATLNCQRCPLGRWLRRPVFYTTYGSAKVLKLPAWAVAFVRHFDNFEPCLRPDIGLLKSRYKGRNQALKALQHIESGADPIL